MVTKDVPQAVTSHGDVITWDEVISDHGNNFDVISSTYVTPYSGSYLLIFHGRVDNKNACFGLIIDGVTRALTAVESVGDFPSVELTLTIYLTAGSRVSVVYAKNMAGNVVGRSPNNDHALRNWFTGYLLF